MDGCLEQLRQDEELSLPSPERRRHDASCVGVGGTRVAGGGMSRGAGSSSTSTRRHGQRDPTGMETEVMRRREEDSLAVLVKRHLHLDRHRRLRVVAALLQAGAHHLRHCRSELVCRREHFSPQSVCPGRRQGCTAAGARTSFPSPASKVSCDGIMGFPLFAAMPSACGAHDKVSTPTQGTGLPGTRRRTRCAPEP